MAEPELRLYNSLSREKQIFTPVRREHVTVYACGPTVYNYAHIGNARMAVVFDVLVRVLRTRYDKVTYVSNITDIEDKIIEAAAAEGVPISEITKKYADIYNNDMATLNVASPDIQPLATDHIPQMISLIEKLIREGKAYENAGHVLFNVPSYKDYGCLSGRSRDDQIAGARIEVAPYKKDPADFILWKPSSSTQPGWDSPWGFGRPGWHIECSAMAEKHLGLPFDIHGGGADLKFPHHENEIAQSCGAHDIPPEDFARYWVHNGFVMVEGQKMSKSLGNVKLVHDLIAQYHPEILRLTLLRSHYRQPLDWTAKTLAESEKILTKYYNLMNMDGAKIAPEDLPSELISPLLDDLNTPGFFANLNTFIKERANDQSTGAIIRGALNLIGLGFDTEWGLNQTSTLSKTDIEKIENLLQERTKARKDKDFKRADEIRDELKALSIEIEDTPDGPKWHHIN